MNKIEAENIIVNLINELKFTARERNTLLMAVHVLKTPVAEAKPKAVEKESEPQPINS